jgi:hypothetical protein
MPNLTPRCSITLLGLCLVFISACGQPVASSKVSGMDESANYKMNRGRTSKIIKDSSANLTMAGECQDEEGEDGWVLEYRWKVKTLLKNFKGDGSECVGKFYFTDEFRETLRAEGSYKHPKAKITHNGYDGRCDDVTFTEIESLADTAKIKARLCDGVPAIRAKAFDIKGRLDGAAAKLGMDWKR